MSLLHRAEEKKHPGQLQFVLLTTHTGYNLFTECYFPDTMNSIVFTYCLSLILLFSNFYIQSYGARKSGHCVLCPAPSLQCTNHQDFNKDNSNFCFL